MDNMYFERIYEVRTQKGLTQKQLANMADIAPGSLSAYEKGLKAPPVDAAARIAKALGVSLDWLFGNESDIGIEEPKSYGDLIKALYPIMSMGLPAMIGTESFYWAKDPIGWSDEEAEGFLLEEQMAVNNKKPKESVISNWASIKIRDVKLAKFFESWSKLYKLYRDGDVEEDVYRIWIEKRIEDLSTEPLPR